MDTVYLLTIVLVALGGIGCAVLAATGFRGANRLTNGLIALACFGYVGYILFSTGDVYVLPFAALIPLGAIVQAFRAPRLRTA